MASTLRKTTVLTATGLLLLAMGACSHTKPVTAPEPTTRSTPSPEAQPATTSPAPSTEVTSEPSLTPAETPEGAIRAGELPADVEAINRAGYLTDAFFDTDKSDLTSEARDALAQDASWLKQHPSVQIVVEGHADERNTEDYNLALGWRRANAVRDYLVSLGVAAMRINTISYGEERPFATGHNEQAWQQNRRAHLVVTAR